MPTDPGTIDRPVRAVPPARDDRLTSAGLTSNESASRRKRDGRNELPHVAQPGPLTIAGRQLVDPVILVLLAAAVLTAVTGSLINTVVIAAVVVLNTVLGAWQEVRSSKAIAGLSDLTAARATVVRDGELRSIDARDVVRGDRLEIAAGDIVAADGQLTQAMGVEVDESVLTGESIPVARAAGDHVSAATVLTRGRGTVIVNAVGAATSLGDIARSVASIKPRPTPLQRQLARLARRLALTATIAALVVGIVSWLQGIGLSTSLVLAVSLAVAAIPESLPAVVSVAMGRAGGRIAAHGVLARSLASVEALGSVSVIASDKTGTLTTGRMAVDQTWTPDGDRVRLLVAAVLCNDAATTRPAGRSHDDPLEVALIEAGAAAGIDVAQQRAENPRIAEKPFDAAVARMTTDHRASHETYSICKGSPEAIFALVSGGQASNAEDQAETEVTRMTASGMRVLGVARRANGGSWRLLGLIGLSDPPRDDAAPTIAAFRAAGVRPIMITGDHPATAGAVAATVGIDVDDVHARVRPDGKLAIIESLRHAGHVVAMTGDGVNDAPALRAADIGIAMGQQGTEVAKQAAGIVLRTDELSAMIPAIVEGRRAYDNVRRFLVYALAGGTAEVLIMLVGPVLGFVVPLQAAQILWINLLTHGLPGVAMGDDPAAAGTATARPRPRAQQVLDRPMTARIAALGTTVAASSTVTAVLARAGDIPWQSTLFLSLLVAQLAVALGLQPRHPGSRPNRWLLAAVGLNLVLGVAAVSQPELADLLQLAPLEPLQLLLALPAAAVSGLLARCLRDSPTAVDAAEFTLPGGPGCSPATRTITA